MSDTSTTPTTPATPQSAPAETPKPTPPPSAPAAPETDWKAEARKWEARSKENSTAAARLAEIEEASKTEAQKQAEALAAAQAEVQRYQVAEQVAAWKAEVAAATGVPATALAGATREEIEAHAEVLKPLIVQPTATPPAPAVVPTIGATPGTQPNISLADQIKAAETDGDKALVGQLKAMQLGALASK